MLDKVQKNARQKNVIAPPSPPLKNVTGAAQTQNDEKIAATGGNGSPCPRVTGDWGQKQKTSRNAVKLSS